jgi:YVTN family beta-propeller protein
VATIAVSNSPYINPYFLAYDSNKSETFVTTTNTNPETGSHTVAVISDISNTVVTSITVGFNPNGIAYDFLRGLLFVANYADNTASVISDSNNSVIANVTVETNPVWVAYDSGKGEIFVSNSGDNTVSVISDSTNASITPTSSIPEFSIPMIILALTLFSGISVIIIHKRKQQLARITAN